MQTLKHVYIIICLFYHAIKIQIDVHYAEHDYNIKQLDLNIALYNCETSEYYLA